jgi:hypothetical protein
VPDSSRLNRDYDAFDFVSIIYVPWEETPGGKDTPKPEGYDEYYEKLGMKPYDSKPFNEVAANYD